jgi:hypothetical protein
LSGALAAVGGIVAAYAVFLCLPVARRRSASHQDVASLVSASTV